MLSPATDPVLAEVAETARELRRARRVARAHSQDMLAHDAAEALRQRLDALLADPETREVVDSALTERASVLRTAVLTRKHELSQRELRKEIDAFAHRAGSARRTLLATERARQAELRTKAAHATDEHVSWLDTQIKDATTRDAVLEAVSSLRLREARSQLERGLLLTRQMRDIIAESLPALMRGEPMLLLGETGGAKTALAEYLSRRLGRQPEFVSGYGDISSTQLIGSHELRPVDGATASVFVPGPLLRAMTTGGPLILDEVNAMPAEFLKRLNRVLQLRPGDSFSVQENAGEQVTVAQGFVILATANEQTPHRYRGIDRMSAELVNRFGANSYRVHYPDHTREYTDTPVENALLAAASIADKEGNIPLSADELERVSRAAFISQQVFSGAHGEGFSEFVSTEREIDGRPGLEESVLAPRTLVAILQKVAGSGGLISLDLALNRFVEGVMHAEDRQVLALILRSQGFLAGPHKGGSRRTYAPSGR
ncbi:AAA family ATPase [Leucobacter denitrificans]|uniref:AAA family ATPase n=1 Tax=Leucobacter denitrificans TaxID=683042 RepID=A0A7G9S5I9_9MICO|nr:AAA family ATPase [Leucobacter denitrificans]QNN63114.1 AAA family ATPase [Leucobacter denitrificans]